MNNRLETLQHTANVTRECLKKVEHSLNETKDTVKLLELMLCDDNGVPRFMPNPSQKANLSKTDSVKETNESAGQINKAQGHGANTFVPMQSSDFFMLDVSEGEGVDHTYVMSTPNFHVGQHRTRTTNTDAPNSSKVIKLNFHYLMYKLCEFFVIYFNL